MDEAERFTDSPMYEFADEHPAESLIARGLPGEVVVEAEVRSLVDRLSDEITARGILAARERGVFHLALSGGSSPRKLFQTLLIDPGARSLPWERTHVWQVDERCVGDEDERRNMRMIRAELLDHVPIPDDHVHSMPVLDECGDAAYERELIATIGEAEPTGVPRLDVALLGMGEDGHTASLFPHSPALRAAGDLAVFNDGETIAPPRPRMTMTYRLINAARHITPLVTGAAKRDALARVALADGFDPALPITGVNPAHEDGKLAWRLDAEAAGPASSG